MATEPVWPDMSIDRKAAKQALDELGDEVPMTKVMERAQQIKDQMKTAGSDYFRFLHPDQPEEDDGDREAEQREDL